MKAVFADTFYFLSLLDSTEPCHVEAVAAASDTQLQLITTQWVLTKFGDAYCHPRNRADFVELYRALINHPRIKIIPADDIQFQRGIEFFSQRQDKDWSLTDCLSFVSMRDEGITEALTGDKHFEQAGFTALLK